MTERNWGKTKKNEQREGELKMVSKNVVGGLPEKEAGEQKKKRSPPKKGRGCHKHLIFGQKDFA